MKTAELQLLAQAGLNPIRETVPLEQGSLMEGLDPTQRAPGGLPAPDAAGRGRASVPPGRPRRRLYVITAGCINVFSASAPAGTALPQRSVSLSPGMMLGEVAMLDRGGRSGDAAADGETEVHALDDSTLQRLRAQDPLRYAQVYRNIALHLSQRLLAAARAWRASTS